ncbi:MAG TPA: D-alanyl-D-alanine carboxypeptidase family protein [Dehalococcoidia bacterium]
MLRSTLVAILALVLAVVVLPTAPSLAAPEFSIPSCAKQGAVADALAVQVPMSTAPLAAPPAITAKSAVVIDGDTGRVLYDLGAHDRRPPASVTKIMTALLTIEHGDLGRTVVSDVDATTMVGSSVMGLRPGVPITIEDLLYGLMLPSGNDAAVLLAENVDGSVPAFVAEMNKKAKELGLKDTHFANPHGLDDPNHYSSAYDLARLARYAMQEPEFAKIVSTQDWHLAPPSDYDLHNGNSLLETYPGADGVKIGWTDNAGWTLVASAQRDGHRLYVTVLDSTDRDADATALFDWAFSGYSWVRLEQKTVDQMRLAERLGIGSALVRSLSVCA